jgi:hypothetical protein
MIVETYINEIDHLTDEVSEMNIIVVFLSQSNKKIISNEGLPLVQQDIYAPKRECSPLTKKWLVNTCT